jgi:predicted regulator of Ras-like GTPase activity (Roadblock/LC7/MglB family)
MTDPEEQLRRLKNTVMGAGHRLSLLAQSGELDADAGRELGEISFELAEAARRLGQLLAAMRLER